MMKKGGGYRYGRRIIPLYRKKSLLTLMRIHIRKKVLFRYGGAIATLIITGGTLRYTSIGASDQSSHLSGSCHPGFSIDDCLRKHSRDQSIIRFDHMLRQIEKNHSHIIFTNLLAGMEQKLIRGYYTILQNKTYTMSQIYVFDELLKTIRTHRISKKNLPHVNFYENRDYQQGGYQNALYNHGSYQGGDNQGTQSSEKPDTGGYTYTIETNQSINTISLAFRIQSIAYPEWKVFDAMKNTISSEGSISGTMLILRFANLEKGSYTLWINTSLALNSDLSSAMSTPQKVEIY